MKSMITPKEMITPSEPAIEQHTLLTSIILHLFPSICVLIGALIAAPLVVRAGFPIELGVLLSSFLLGVSLRLGYLFYQAKKQHGTFSLRGIVLYWGRMPLWHYLLIFIPFLVYALGLEVVLQPVSKTLIAHVFWWLPMALLPSTAAVKLTTATLVTALLVLLLDGLIDPLVEELYYRGYLLPRLERLGWFAPVLNSLLFTPDSYPHLPK